MVFLGDIHSRFNVITDHPHLRHETIIQVGDFGLGFKSLEEDIKPLKILIWSLEDSNNKLYVIRGNHDFPSYWKNPIKEQINALSPNFILVSDYEILEINNRKILFIGGADSVDKSGRTEGVDWWADEGVQIGDICGKFDWVVTHTAPNICYPFFYDENIQARKERAYLTEIFEKYKPERWFYGHFHKSNSEIIDNCNFRLLNINEFYEIY